MSVHSALSRIWPSFIRTKLEGSAILRKIFENISWLVFDRVAPILTAFIVNVIVIRYLGPSQFGLYSYALSFAAMFATLASLGSDPIIIRELTRATEREGEILGTALVMRLVAALVVWVIAIVAVIQLRDDILTRILVAILAGQTVTTAMGVFDCWFRAKIAARTMVILRASVALFGQAGRIVLVVIGATLPAFALLLVGTSLLASVIVAVKCRRASGQKLVFNIGRARQLARDSWPFLIMSISVMVYMKIDQVMLTSMSGAHENGIYATAVTLSELWYFLPMAISNTVFPLIVKAHDSAHQASFEKKLQLFYDAMTALGYCVAIPIFIFANPIVHMLYGSAYEGTANILRVHVASFVFVCIGIARGNFLIVKNYNIFNMLTSVAAAVLNVTLNLILIPPYGAIGAAWSTFISYMAANYVSGFFSADLRRQTWMLTKSLALPLRLRELRRNISEI